MGSNSRRQLWDKAGPKSGQSSVFDDDEENGIDFKRVETRHLNQEGMVEISRSTAQICNLQKTVCAMEGGLLGRKRKTYEDDSKLDSGQWRLKKTCCKCLQRKLRIYRGA